MANISDYKKKHPEYSNIPDLELAEVLYEKVYKNKLSENEFYRLAFPNISEERPEEAEIIFPDDEFGGNFEFASTATPFKPTTSEIAKQAGVSVNDPASSKARLAASLGYNQEQKALAVKNVLSDSFDTDIDVRVGPETGELEYYNPKTESYSLVDKPGLDLGDFADLGGDALVILPDLVVTYYTAGLGKALGFGAIAAGLGEYARLKAGQAVFDINLDLSDEQLFYEGLKTAGISLGAGVTGVTIAKGIKGVNNLIKGRSFFQIEEGVKALDDPKFQSADEVAASINQRLEDAKVQSRLKFTLAESLDDPDLLAVQSSFENVRRLGKTGEFTEFGQKQAGALNEYFSQIKKVFGDSSGSTYDTGKVISEVIEKRQSDALKNIIKKQEVSEDLLKKSIFKLPDGSEKVTGTQFRSIINDLSNTYKSKANLAATELDAASGLKTIKTDEISKAITRLTENEQRVMLNVAKTEGLFKPEAFKQIMDPKGFIPLKNARETVSTLGKLIREKEIGLAAGETVDVGKLKFLQSAYTKQIKKNAGADYLNELQKFNELVRTNKELLNNDIISKLTKIEIGNVLKIADEDIFQTTFKKGIGSEKAAKEVYDVISKSPEALNAYKNSIFNLYKEKVLIEGKPNLSNHNAFLKNYEKPLRVFFNKDDYRKILRIGGLQKNIEKTNKLFADTQKQLLKSFEGKLIAGSPSEIFNKIFKQGKIGEVKTLKNILAKNPEVEKKFKRDILTDLNERVTKKSDRLNMRVLDPKAFDEYLNGKGGERGFKSVLKEIFDDEYINNLELLNRALQISGRKLPRAQEAPLANAFTDIIRARLGQFTTPGRLFTAGRRLFMAASNRIIAKALLDPTSLKQLLELRKLSKFSERASIILSTLGGSIFILPDEGVMPPSKTETIDQEVEGINLNKFKKTDFGSQRIIDQVSSLLNEGEGADDGISMTQANLQTPPINTSLVATRPMNQGLTAVENALLSDEEKAIRLRSRGLA